MIAVTRLNGTPLQVNANLIEMVESTPDTLLVLTTGRKIMVSESVEDVTHRILQYHRLVHAPSRRQRPSKGV